jgi:hypothetical protein
MLNLHLGELRAGGWYTSICLRCKERSPLLIYPTFFSLGVKYATAESTNEQQRKSLGGGGRWSLDCTVSTAGYALGTRRGGEGAFVQGKEVCHEFVNYKGAWIPLILERVVGFGCMAG